LKLIPKFSLKPSITKNNPQNNKSNIKSRKQNNINPRHNIQHNKYLNNKPPISALPPMCLHQLFPPPINMYLSFIDLALNWIYHKFMHPNHWCSLFVHHRDTWYRFLDAFILTCSNLVHYLFMTLINEVRTIQIRTVGFFWSRLNTINSLILILNLLSFLIHPFEFQLGLQKFHLQCCNNRCFILLQKFVVGGLHIGSHRLQLFQMILTDPHILLQTAHHLRLLFLIP
jgi:hypothetical protein